MPSLVAVEVENGIGRLMLNRPAAHNAINPALVFQMHQALRALIERTDVRGIVVAGAGKAFAAGVDVGFFLRNIEAGQIERIVQFARAGHALFNELDGCPKPVVATIHGMALGGGLELALACDRILVSPRASLGLPETRLGLYPGLGGTQRTSRKIGPSLAKWMIYTARTLSAPEAREVGLIEQVVAEEMLYATACRAIAEGVEPLPPAARTPELAALETFFASHPLDALLTGELAGDRPCLGAVRLLRDNGPWALHMVEWLIDEGLRRTLAEGLQLEIDRSAELFATRDAYEGLTAMGQRRPVFQGC
jgi:enoyl-CoA hydratase/carnithine racemase